MVELLGAGILNVLQAKYLLSLVIGTLAGVVGGALPGVTITMTIILILPFTFGLDPLQGLAAMTGVYVGGSAGGHLVSLLALTETTESDPKLAKFSSRTQCTVDAYGNYVLERE